MIIKKKVEVEIDVVTGGELVCNENCRFFKFELEGDNNICILFNSILDEEGSPDKFNLRCPECIKQCGGTT